MSTLNVSNITDGTTTVGTSYVVNGSAKVHCTYDCDPATVLGSHNVSSLTDNGTGDHTVNMTNAFSGIYYTPATHGKYLTTTKGGTVAGNSTSTKTASALQLHATHGSALSGADMNEVNVSIHGDLA